MIYDVYCKLVISAYQSGKIDEKTYDTFPCIMPILSAKMSILAKSQKKKRNNKKSLCDSI